MSDISQLLAPAAIGTPSYRDLVIDQGDLVLTNDVSTQAAATDPVIQNVIQNLLTYLGEWFLNTSIGTPWLQSVVVKKPDQAGIDAIIQDKILGTPGVRVLTAYQSQSFRAQRLLKVSFSIITNAGAAISYNLPISLGDGA